MTSTAGTMSCRVRRGADLVLVFAAPFDGHAARASRDDLARRCARFTSSTKPPRSRPCTLACTKTRSRPFSLAISLAPTTRRMSASWPSGMYLAARASRRAYRRAARCRRARRAPRAPGWGKRCAAFDRRGDVLPADAGLDDVEQHPARAGRSAPSLRGSPRSSRYGFPCTREGATPVGAGDVADDRARPRRLSSAARRDCRRES